MKTTDEQIKTVEAIRSKFAKDASHYEAQHWESEESDARTKHAALTAILAELRESRELLEAAKWIPVSERLPESHGESYLVTDSAGYVSTTQFFVLHGKGVWRGVQVVAWMPLPEPYSVLDAFAEVKK